MEPEISAARRNGARVLVVTASVLAFLAVFALWINRQVLDTDNWTDASSQMLAQPAVRDQTAAYLTDQLFENVDVEAEIRAALPPQAQALAAPATGFLRDRVELRARNLLAHEKTQELWEGANRKAHEMFLGVLDGGSDVVSTKNGEVVLDLKTLLTNLEESSGVGAKAAAALPASAAQLTVLESDDLATAQDVANILDALPIVLVALSLLSFAAALLVAPGYRRHAVRGFGVGLLAAGAAALAAGAWIGDLLVDSLAKTAATEPAVRATWDVYDTLLIQAATATLFYGAVTLLFAWLAGPTTWAVKTRRASAPYLRRPAIAYGGIAAIVLIVIVWWAPTPATRNPATAVLLTALLAGGLELLRRQTAREHPLASAYDPTNEQDKEEANGHARVGTPV